MQLSNEYSTIQINIENKSIADSDQRLIGEGGNEIEVCEVFYSVLDKTTLPQGLKVVQSDESGDYFMGLLEIEEGVNKMFVSFIYAKVDNGINEVRVYRSEPEAMNNYYANSQLL